MLKLELGLNRAILMGGKGEAEGPAPGAPIVANQSASFGALTAAGAGAWTPTNTGGAITSASITSGNAAGHWQIDTNGRITPTMAGDTANLAGGPYSLGCSFTNASGSDTATITIATSGSDLENTAHVLNDTQYNTWAALRATMSGKVCQYRNGSRTAFCHNQIVWRLNVARTASQYKRFLLGDFGVLAGFTVSDRLPAWDGARHGCMLDMGLVADQGFYNRAAIDSYAITWQFASASRTTYPVSMPDDAVHVLTSSIGLTTPVTGSAAQMLERVACLTSIPTALFASVTATTLRPPMMGTKKLIDFADADLTMLPDLAVPAGATMPATGQMAFPWLHNGPSDVSTEGMPSLAATIHPGAQMPPYPRDMAELIGDYFAALLLDHANRDTYAKELAQVGLDFWGCHHTGPSHVMMGSGGFGNGWKPPIVFLGMILGGEDPDLLDFNQFIADKWSGLIESFGEDGMTYIGTDELDPPTPRFMWGLDFDALGYSQPYFGNHYARDPDGLAEVEPPPGYSDDGVENGGYRLCCTSGAWVGYALFGAHVSEFAEQWGDHWYIVRGYVERWVADAYTLGQIHLYGSAFVEDVWTEYPPEGADVTSPFITSTTPSDNATDVAITVSPAATFDEDVEFGTGTINLHRTSDDVLIESFNVVTEVGTGNGQVSIAGDVLTINPTSSLANSVGYYVLIDATAIEDAAGNAFAGIASKTVWNFTTVAAGFPELLIDPDIILGTSGGNWTFGTSWSHDSGSARKIAGGGGFSTLTNTANITGISGSTNYRAIVRFRDITEPVGNIILRITEAVGGSTQHQTNVALSSLSVGVDWVLDLTTGAGVSEVDFTVLIVDAGAGFRIESCSLKQRP